MKAGTMAFYIARISYILRIIKSFSPLTVSSSLSFGYDIYILLLKGSLVPGFTEMTLQFVMLTGSSENKSIQSHLNFKELSKIVSKYRQKFIEFIKTNRSALTCAHSTNPCEKHSNATNCAKEGEDCLHTMLDP